MPSLEAVSLTPDEIDDLLYLTRVNESTELQQFVADLAAKHACPPGNILLNGVDPESRNTVIHYASANGHLALLKTLLSQLSASLSPDALSTFINTPNGEGNTALHWAAYRGQLEVVKALTAAGANMWLKNGAGHLAVFEAERAEQNEVVQFLLEVGGEVVEKAGAETPASAEDVQDIDVGEGASSAADGSGEAAGSAVSMENGEGSST